MNARRRAAGSVIIYCRISRDRDETRLGVERQEQDCRELAQRLGLSGRIEVVVDNDKSAYSRRRRPGWERVVEQIRGGEVGHLIAWHADRLYRRTRDLGELIDLLDDNPVEIHTVTSGDIDLSTASGRMAARIVGAVAEHESEHKAERISRAARQRAERGEWSGGKRPLGYERDGVTLREPEASVLRDAADRILRGEPSTTVAQWVSSQLGVAITQRVLRRALLAPHIAGLRWHWPASERRAWAARRARGEVTGEYPLDVMLASVTDGTWPAVIDPDDWRALHARFRSGEAHARPRRSLLAGILTCSRCGHPLGWGDAAAETKTGRHATYRCIASSGGCGRTSIAAVAVDTWLEAVVRGALAEHADELRAARPGTRSRESPHASQRRELEARLDALAEALADGVLDRRRYDVQSRRLQRQLDALGPAEAADQVRRRRKETALTIVARWDNAPLAERREAVKALISRVIVFPVGRGRAVRPEYRCVIVWADDDRELTEEQWGAMLPPPPPPDTPEQQRLARNARDREKRRVSAAARAAGTASEEQRRQHDERLARQRRYRARLRAATQPADGDR